MLETVVAKNLISKELTLSVAESCTGGLISDSLTNIPGSSGFFILGIIAYSNDVKIKIVGVPAELIKRHGAVSKEVALEMAKNIRHIGQSNIGIGITGIAGPGGGTALKPVGTVFIAISIGHNMYFKKYELTGSRLKIKKAAKDAALKLLKECLS